MTLNQFKKLVLKKKVDELLKSTPFKVESSSTFYEQPIVFVKFGDVSIPIVHVHADMYHSLVEYSEDVSEFAFPIASFTVYRSVVMYVEHIIDYIREWDTFENGGNDMQDSVRKFLELIDVDYDMLEKIALKKR